MLLKLKKIKLKKTRKNINDKNYYSTILKFQTRKRIKKRKLPWRKC